MRYVLQDDIALKSWTDRPCNYVVMDGTGSYPTPLTREQYDFLCRCDGTHDMENEDDLVRYFTIRGVIEPADGRVTPSWQNQVCPNAFHAAVLWEITSRCNLNCIHCFNAADDGRKAAQFTLEEARSFIGACRDAGILGFRLTGGEPMVHPDFFAIVDEITSQHMQLIQLETNAMFLSEEVLDRLQRVNPSLQFRISFDGLSSHDAMRRCPGSEKIVLDAIARVVRRGFPVLVNVNVNFLTRDRLYDTILCLADLGVAAVRLIRTSEAPRWEQNGQDITLSVQDYFDLAIDCAARYKSSGRRANLIVWQVYTLYPASRSFRCRAVKGRCDTFDPNEPQCPFTETAMVAVAANGNVLPCHGSQGFFEANGFALSNAKEGNFSDILNHKLRYYKTVGEALAVNPTCSSCPYVRICRGGCPALGRLYGGYFGAPDPTKCLMLKGGYYEKLCEAMEGWRNRIPRD